ncbi:mandelate racemase/muconate lactonizing enzyme family protein [Rhizobium sp. NTR19]|uniref:Mandelate racemase/muconate lactonizing enzyme family protein n=1 Tax=Neorhizobium turbinariae TaxID=2937795 RepID=A0ABT0IWT4_9HYPH|nr:mandelate racemase/muconate lactonizing enzyme family protein [Neorhizobium turbinariae]MCK8782300.1 mandelate racemase/muconate lactonizing enzyme family protein [Neorhizobium turbinariae]
MSDRVRSVEAFTLTIPRDTPYLGASRPGEEPNAKGYLVRRSNKTVYPTFDRSILVRIETQNGVVGWGETYGIVAPGAVLALIEDLLADFTIGRDPLDPAVIHDDLYDLMRVRGYTGGFYLDALAAIDIALWDIAGRIAGLPIARMLGGKRRDSLPAYVSGLPEATREKRADMARHWQDKGFDSFKFASPVADDGVAAEMETLREALGATARIACDMHWNHTAREAIGLIGAMEPYGLWFAEAPVRTEDIGGLGWVASNVTSAIAVGEEWRTVFDMQLRLERANIAIVQPEMGHKGITEFMRIGQLAHVHHLEVIPHATIGGGIFLAASLQASFALPTVTAHEFQHSIFEPNRRLLKGDMDCREGYYRLANAPGLGVEPSEEALSLLKRR